MSAGGAEREARELADKLTKRIWPLITENDFFTERDAIQPIVAEALGKCANEARLEALEQAAQTAEDAWSEQGSPVLSEEGLYIARLIRALKAVPPPKPAREG